MKNNIYIGLSLMLILLSLSLYGLFRLYDTEKSELKRVTENITAILTDRANQQVLTVSELKTLYPKYDSLAKFLHIKSKDITNIIEMSYHFKDTTLIKTILKHDSVTEKRLFSFKENCYHFSGFINRDTIALTEKSVTDKLTTILYKDWRHRYFFKLIKIKPFYTAKVFSFCMQDTVCVENNIKIQEK